MPMTFAWKNFPESKLRSSPSIPVGPPQALAAIIGGTSFRGVGPFDSPALLPLAAIDESNRVPRFRRSEPADPLRIDVIAFGKVDHQIADAGDAFVIHFFDDR